jgi:hypothetical protein
MLRECSMLGLWLATLCLLPACSAGSGSGGSGASSGSGASAGTGGSATGGASSGGTGTGSGGASTGDGQIGDACSTNADCTAVAGAECWTTIGGGPVPEITFPGGFCSKACDTGASENECGDIAACVSLGMSGGQSSVTLTMCTPPCKTNEECRVAEGYHCQVVLPGFGYCSL